MVEGARLRELSPDLPRRPDLSPDGVRALAPSTALRAVPLPRVARGGGSPHREPSGVAARRRRSQSPGHLVPYSVNTKSRPSTIVWQAKPHLASLPCGGWFASVPGPNVFAAAS